MRLEHKTTACQLQDDELLAVSGGISLQNEMGDEVKEGRFVTSTFSNYASGELPRFSIGDLVKINWKVNSQLTVPCNAEVMGISNSRNAGLMFRRYTYCVRIRSCPNSDMVGTIETGVHENCLSL